jgi:hypothetical protein
MTDVDMWLAPLLLVYKLTYFIKASESEQSNLTFLTNKQDCNLVKKCSNTS